MHSDFQYQQIAEPEELSDAGRIKWVEGRPGDTPSEPGRISHCPGTVALPQAIRNFSGGYWFASGLFQRENAVPELSYCPKIGLKLQVYCPFF